MSRKGNHRSQPGSEGISNREERKTVQGAGERSDARGSADSGNSGQGGPDFNNDEIAARAYQIFEREGRMDGRDMDHWLQAERELRMEREKRSGAMNAQNAPRSARQHQQSGA